MLKKRLNSKKNGAVSPELNFQDKCKKKIKISEDKGLGSIYSDFRNSKFKAIFLA